MSGGNVYGLEGVGRLEYKDGTASERAFHGGGRKDREEKIYQATRKTEGGLFEAIGQYFRLSSQAEQMEAQNAASCLEGHEECVDTFQVDGASVATFSTENVCTLTSEDGLDFVADTKSAEPFRRGYHSHLFNG